MRSLRWFASAFAVALAAGTFSPLASAGQDVSPLAVISVAAALKLHALAPQLARLAGDTAGLVAVSVGDLRTGHAIAVNGGINLPAASTIKIPVMVEVFRQIAVGRFSLRRTVSLTDGDRDSGYGDLADAPWGSAYSVSTLLTAMIDNSDNTATNMLIRLVGRRNINATMSRLGLDQTRLGDSIRSDGDIRELRTSANDMLRLLTMIAAGRVVDTRSSAAMLEILEGQRHNDLLPAPLPKSLIVAHKTGTLHDTLIDVGIVELDGAPYVICTFATHLSDLDDGQRFIRRASFITFETFRSAAKERNASNARL